MIAYELVRQAIYGGSRTNELDRCATYCHLSEHVTGQVIDICCGPELDASIGAQIARCAESEGWIALRT